jgi:hypothetical protein
MSPGLKDCPIVKGAEFWEVDDRSVQDVTTDPTGTGGTGLTVPFRYIFPALPRVGS